MDLKLAKKIYIIIFSIAFLSGCVTENPNDISYQNHPSKRGSNTYYRQTQPKGRPNYGSTYQAPSYQKTQQYRPPKADLQKSPYGGNGYQGRATSRYYSNPYEVSPKSPYPYYDSDQYYVAPTYYGTTDINVPDGGFEKF